MQNFPVAQMNWVPIIKGTHEKRKKQKKGTPRLGESVLGTVKYG